MLCKNCKQAVPPTEEGICPLCKGPLVSLESKPRAKPEPGPEEDPVPEPDLREDLRGQADQLHDLLEKYGSLTYAGIGEMLNPPVTPKRASRLVGQMIRDGVELKREGKPRKVSLG